MSNVALKTNKANTPVEKPLDRFLSGVAIGMTSSALSSQLMLIDDLLTPFEDPALDQVKSLLFAATNTAIVLDSLCENAGLL